MLLSTDFATVQTRAAGVTCDAFVLSEKLATHWYIDADGRGFVGLDQGAMTFIIKALFVYPTERELGFGDRLLTQIIDLAGNVDIEIIADRDLHRWLARHGFIAVRKMKKQGWLMRRPMAFSS